MAWLPSGEMMDLINVATARSMWTFDIVELNNQGRRLYPDVLGLIREHYDFDDEEDPPKPENKFKLLNGAYQAKRGLVNISLQVFNDGIWAETTSNTEDSDAFLEDLLSWLKSELGMNYHPRLVKIKGNISELVVHSDVALGAVCRKFKLFADRLSTVSLYQKIEHQELAAVFFGASEKSVSSFTFERKAATPFEESKFYCRAPLATDLHFELLKEFEGILLG
jgi:hypothetical protein